MKSRTSLFPVLGAVALISLIGTAASLTANPAGSPSIRALPFSNKSGDGAAMHFTAITAAESGLTVENPYDDPEMWGSRYTEFQGGAIGTGVAVGDVDGDGLVDVYVVNKTRPNQLFRQTAPFRFEDITERAGVPGGSTWGTGATMADIDGDGDLDLYVCQFDAPNLLYINQGDGTFTEEARARGLDLVSGSVVGAFEDYDRDGDLDVYVVTNIRNAIDEPDGDPDHLYRNNGDGTFTEVTEAAGIDAGPGRGHSATWTDFNGDGWPDLYVANDFAVPDHMYQNNGDGTFTAILERSVPHTAWFAMGSDSADINNDGMFDLFVGEMAATTHFKAKVAMGDMGGLVDYMDTLVVPQYMKNTLFLNTGTDRFREIARLAHLSSSDWTWSPRFEDLDNDGWVDLHLTNGMVRNFIDSDLNDIIKRSSNPRDAIALMKNSPPLREVNFTFHNHGDLHFKRIQDDWGLRHEGISFGSAFADFDNDGDLDLIYTNYNDTVSLYRNDSPSGHSIVVQLQGRGANTHAVGAVIHAHTSAGIQTRRLTVARGVLSSSEPIAHFGLGSDTAVEKLEIRWPSGAVQTLENLAADQRYVVTEPEGTASPDAPIRHRLPKDGLLVETTGDSGIDFVNEERRFNDMVRQSLLPNRMNTLGGGIARGDVDGDGDVDVYFAGPAGRAGVLYLNDGHGRFAAFNDGQPWTAEAETEEMAPLFLDIDSDGDLDLYVTSGSVEADAGSDLYLDHLYLNNGHGRFTAAAEDAVPARRVSNSVVAAADFDRDGDLDLFVGGRVIPGDYPRAPESALLENRGGRLVDVTEDIAPALRSIGMVTAAVWSDADGDGHVDLLVTGEWMPVHFFRNTEGRLVDHTEGAGLADIKGWWNTLAAADIDADGDIDYLAGNTGHNTKYHASHDHPVEVYYGDFEGSGKCEIVEAKYVGDTLYPVRGLSCSSRAMPSIRERFPTFRDFGSAVLEDIYPEQKLEQSIHYSVTELSSGVFINDGHGRFTFKPFPTIAQVAPVFGIATADFDGDGNLDVFLGENFRGPQVETGRFDNGISQILLGDGDGGFAPVTAMESGIMIPGEVRGAALGDANADGVPELLLTVINEPVRTYTMRHEQFGVTLHGKPGNTSAAGARVTATTDSGRRQTAEMYAGSGYLSQAEPTIFFPLTPEDPVKSVEVIWPDGSRSTHEVTRGQVRLEADLQT